MPTRYSPATAGGKKKAKSKSASLGLIGLPIENFSSIEVTISLDKGHPDILWPYIIPRSSFNVGHKLPLKDGPLARAILENYNRAYALGVKDAKLEIRRALAIREHI